MTSVSTHRRRGINSSAAIKVACVCATTANITLSGEQTVDGIALLEGDRCFVKDQTDGTENGIYDVSTGDWTRSPDFDGAFDVVEGTIIPASRGTANADTEFRVTNTGTISIGDDSLTFERRGASDSEFVTYTPAGTDAVSTTVETKLRESVSVKDFGALGDGVTDDTAQIQAALDAGGAIYLPAGTYIISSALDVTVTSTKIMGDGFLSKIHTNSATADIFTITSTLGGAITNVIFENFHVQSTVTKTAGYAFNALYAARMQFRGVRMGDPSLTRTLFNGIYLNHFDNCLVDNCYFGTRGAGTGIKCHGSPTSTFGSELTIGGKTRMVNTEDTGNGIHIGGGAGGVYIDDMSISGYGTGVLVDDTLQSGVNNREVFFGSEFIVDSCGTVGVQFSANAVSICQMTGGWIATCGDEGINIKPDQVAAFRMVITGTRIFNCENDGIAINDSNVSVADCYIHNNGNTSPFGHGINVANSAVDGLTITGNHIVNNGASGTGYGVRIISGVTDMLVTDNYLDGNNQGAIDNSTTLTNTEVIKDNIGYVTETTGTATVLNTNTSVTVTHNMDVTPTNIGLSATGLQNATFYLRTSSIGATTFVINYGATASADRTIHWQATSGVR